MAWGLQPPALHKGPREGCSPGHKAGTPHMARTRATAIRWRTPSNRWGGVPVLDQTRMGWSVHGQGGPKGPVPAAQQHRRRRRRAPGVVAAKEVAAAQVSTAKYIPAHAFKCLVREVATQWATGLRFQRSAVEALQEAAEAYLVTVFGHGAAAAAHAHRFTLQVKDLELALCVGARR